MAVRLVNIFPVKHRMPRLAFVIACQLSIATATEARCNTEQGIVSPSEASTCATCLTIRCAVSLD